MAFIYLFQRSLLLEEEGYSRRQNNSGVWKKFSGLEKSSGAGKEFWGWKRVLVLEKFLGAGKFLDS